MPLDCPDASSPLDPFEGSFDVPELGITRRWFDARDLTPDTCAEVVDLIGEAFNGEADWFALPVAPTEHFAWKFRDRPTGVTVSLTLDPDGKVIGFLGGVRRVWLLQGRPYVVRSGYDLCRSPAWQGRGLARAFQRFRGSEWHPSEDFGFGYVTHPADRHMSMERGEQAPANETHDYVRVLRPLRLAAGVVQARRKHRRDVASNTARVLRSRDEPRVARFRRAGRRAISLAASIAARRPARRDAALTLSTITRFTDEHELFIADAMSQFDFIAERSNEFLNWRYCDERAGPFTVRLAERDGEYLGYAVTRVYRGRAHLADILVRPGLPAVTETLVRDSIRLAREGGAATIRTRLPRRHPYRDALTRTGFFDLGHVAGELIAPRDTPPEELAFLDDEHTRIHHVLADSDFL